MTKPGTAQVIVAAVMARDLERCICLLHILTQKTGSEKFPLPDKPQNLIKTKNPPEHYGFIHR